MKKFLIITLFPEIVEPVLNSSMMWKAQKDSIVSFQTLNLRDFGSGPRRQVDDKTFGGGVGMLLMIEPLTKAINKARQLLPNAKVIAMTPTDNIWDQEKAAAYAASDNDYIMLCGRYEGFDARVFSLVDEKISIGQFVLTGGELPALAIIDSVVRLLPGVLGGGDQATAIESYSSGSNIEYPQYTRPRVYQNQTVPDVLLSGNHQLIEEWRNSQANQDSLI